MALDLEDKENRRTIQNRSRSPQSPDHEDIICAPSIPLILSTSSTCSSPSPSPLSPALSSSSHSSKKFEGRKVRNDSVCNSPSPKSSAVSPSPKSPRSTPNGIVSKQNKIDEKKKPDSPLKQDPSISLQNLLLAAVAQNQMDLSKGEYPRLPIPPELVPHLLSRIPEGKPGLGLPLRPGDPALLPYLAPELALNLPPPPPPPPHVLVKQGESKCNECNIVFYRIENFVAHKMYYCGANAATKMTEEKPVSPPMTTSPKELPKEPAPSTSKLPVYQFICAACGIKFTSYDNLTAHQTYYCPKRANVDQDKLRRCPKCKVFNSSPLQYSFLN